MFGIGDFIIRFQGILNTLEYTICLLTETDNWPISLNIGHYNPKYLSVSEKACLQMKAFPLNKNSLVLKVPQDSKVILLLQTNMTTHLNLYNQPLS